MATAAEKLIYMHPWVAFEKLTCEEKKAYYRQSHIVNDAQGNTINLKLEDKSTQEKWDYVLTLPEDEALISRNPGREVTSRGSGSREKPLRNLASDCGIPVESDGYGAREKRNRGKKVPLKRRTNPQKGKSGQAQVGEERFAHE